MLRRVWHSCCCCCGAMPGSAESGNYASLAHAQVRGPGTGGMGSDDMPPDVQPLAPHSALSFSPPLSQEMTGATAGGAFEIEIDEEEIEMEALEAGGSVQKLTPKLPAQSNGNGVQSRLHVASPRVAGQRSPALLQPPPNYNFPAPAPVPPVPSGQEDIAAAATAAAATAGSNALSAQPRVSDITSHDLIISSETTPSTGK